MKKFNLIVLLPIIFSVACTKSTKSPENSEAASSIVQDCDFNVLVFSSYSDEDGKLTYDYEKMQAWSREGTHNYAIKNNSEIESASVEILKNGKTLEKINLNLKKAGLDLTQLDDSGKIKSQLREMGELKPKMSLSFTFNTKAKKACKKDIGIFLD